MLLNQLTIQQAHDGLENREFSTIELISAVFKQIKKRDKDLPAGKAGIHAFLEVNEKQAMLDAEKVDRKIARNEEIGILEGIPAAIKDNILVKDIKCTAGSKILENYIAPYDATVIQKLKKAGAVIVGKTNLDEFAMGSSTENSAFGPTKNPDDLSRVPGGSSGGSAAAVAADECIFALGSDTGGSIRQPASFCGMVGLKPTYGSVSRYGLIAMASSLDVIGVLTKNIKDAKIVFETIKGKDEMDSTSTDIGINKSLPVSLRGGDSRRSNPEANYGIAPLASLARNDNMKGLKIGLPKEYFIKGLDPEVEKAIKEAISKFEKMGVKIQEISLPYTEYALSCYYIIVFSEISANLARYDGIRYGASAAISSQQSAVSNLLERYLKTRAAYLGDEVKRRIMLGAFTLSSGYYEAYYLKAQKVRTKILNDFNRAFEKVDIIITPTSPTTAFKIGEKIDDPLQMYLSDIFTVPVNLAGLPAISAPCGRDKDGLAVGMQIIGPQFSEDLIFEAAGFF